MPSLSTIHYLQFARRNTTLLTIHFDNPPASAVLGTIHQFESGAHHTDSGPGAPLSQPYLPFAKGEIQPWLRTIQITVI